MKKVMIFALLVCVTFSMSAQTFDSSGYGSRQFTNDMFQLDEYIKRTDKGIKYNEKGSYSGTPYNNPNYLFGSVYKEGALWANNVALRYNAISDEIEIKQDLNTSDSEAKVLTKSPDVFVKIINDIYVFAPYKGGIEGGGYFHVLYEGGQLDLYKKPKKKFTPGKKATTSLTRDLPASFKDKPVYYLVDKTGKYYELPASKGKKLKVFGKNKDAVKAYAREKGLDLNAEKDLIKVVKFINSL